MFSLILTIISVTLVAALALSTMYYGAHELQHPSAAQSEALAAARANDILDQAQQLLGAATLYAGQHAGVFPTKMAQLESGNYLKTALTPPDDVSPGNYSLDSDKDGFRVSLTLSDMKTCDYIATTARQNSAPYNCVVEKNGYTFTYRS